MYWGKHVTARITLVMLKVWGTKRSTTSTHQTKIKGWGVLVGAGEQRVQMQREVSELLSEESNLNDTGGMWGKHSQDGEGRKAAG